MKLAKLIKRLRRYKRLALYIITALIFIGAVMIFAPKAVAGKPIFEIKKGQSLAVTARLLAQEHLIYSRYLFEAYALLTDRGSYLRAGNYALPSSVSTESLLEIFTTGRGLSNDLVITVPEGTNLAEIDQVFARSGLLASGQLLNAKNLSREGYLFPDTYRFQPHTSPADVVNKLSDTFTAKVGDAVSASGDHLKTTIIIASMLEKEVRTQQDMQLVAGIIQRRLKLGMPLQLDATVAYGACLHHFTQGLFCDVSQVGIAAALHVDGPYNTYTRKGLPAGPISNPGLQAIQAALHPQASDYLYYLNAPDGTTIYSKTAAEHERARQKYLH